METDDDLARLVHQHFDDCEENKKLFPSGPWCHEPNRLSFKHCGLDCLLSRNSTLGFWCGYVAIPREHPLHGRYYTDNHIEIHGGLTYGEKSNGLVCHPHETEEDDIWWLGFDCVHVGDAYFDYMTRLDIKLPSLPSRDCLPKDIYRDITYVTAEVERLAEQLAYYEGFNDGKK